MSKSAAAFKRVETLTLPSGVEVEARKPDLERLVMEADENTVPQFLTQQVASSLGAVSTFKATEPDNPQVGLNKLSRFMDVIVRASIVWPEIVNENPDYEAGQILITDLTSADRQFIFTWGMPAQQQTAATFPEKSSRRVAARSDVPALQPATVNGHGD